MNKKPTNNDQGRNETESDSRRKLLRYLVAGGGVGTTTALVPGTWTKPVIETVLLPAHAQASISPFNGTGLVGSPGDIARIDETQFSTFQEFIASVRNAVLSDAQAAIVRVPLLSCIGIKVDNLLDEASEAVVTLTSNIFGVDTGTGTLGQLQDGGIVTQDAGATVIANTLNPDGSGNGTVNGTPFELESGDCRPLDGDGESPKPGP